MAERYAGVAKKRKEVLRSDRNTMEQLNKQCDPAQYCVQCNSSNNNNKHIVVCLLFVQVLPQMINIVLIVYW